MTITDAPKIVTRHLANPEPWTLRSYLNADGYQGLRKALTLPREEILAAVGEAARADGWAPLSSVRQALGKRMPGFNLRNYKHRKFRDLVAAVDGIETRESQSASGPVISVRHLAPPPA